MRSLSELTIQEKAELLHQLIPNEIPRFLSHLGNFAFHTVNDAAEVKQNWKGKRIPLTADQWIALAQQVADKIKEDRKVLKREYLLFARHIQLPACLLRHVSLPLSRWCEVSF